MLRGSKAKIAIYAWFLLIGSLSVLNHDGWGLYNGCDILHRLTYPFFHQNIFHALVNLWALYQCVKAFRCRWNLAIFYGVAVSYPFASASPVIGLSGIVYAYMGFIAPYVKRKIKYNLTILLYISVGFVFPCMAIGVHIYCYALGLLWGYLNAPLCKDK